jgi:hypothetical protein
MKPVILICALALAGCATTALMRTADGYGHTPKTACI